MYNKKPKPEGFLTKKEFGERTGICYRTVQKYIKEGKITTENFDGHELIHESEIKKCADLRLVKETEIKVDSEEVICEKLGKAIGKYFEIEFIDSLQGVKNRNDLINCLNSIGMKLSKGNVPNKRKLLGDIDKLFNTEDVIKTAGLIYANANNAREKKRQKYEIIFDTIAVEDIIKEAKKEAEFLVGDETKNDISSVFNSAKKISVNNIHYIILRQELTGKYFRYDRPKEGDMIVYKWKDDINERIYSINEIIDRLLNAKNILAKYNGKYFCDWRKAIVPIIRSVYDSYDKAESKYKCFLAMGDSKHTEIVRKILNSIYKANRVEVNELFDEYGCFCQCYKTVISEIKKVLEKEDSK